MRSSSIFHETSQMMESSHRLQLLTSMPPRTHCKLMAACYMHRRILHSISTPTLCLKTPWCPCCRQGSARLAQVCPLSPRPCALAALAGVAAMAGCDCVAACSCGLHTAPGAGHIICIRSRGLHRGLRYACYPGRRRAPPVRVGRLSRLATV